MSRFLPINLGSRIQNVMENSSALRNLILGLLNNFARQKSISIENNNDFTFNIVIEYLTQVLRATLCRY